MRILVTGAGGFAGRQVADTLHANGYEVVGTVHSSEIKAAFKTVRLDLAEPWPDMGCFDAIINTAGVLPQRVTAYSAHVRAHIDVMRRLIAYAKERGIPRVVNYSSIGIYGEIHTETIDEDTDRVNPDAYGMTKYMAECLLRETDGIESISLRMPGVIGKGSRDIWLTRTIEKFRCGEPVHIYTPDFPTRNFVWNQDLAEFVVQLLQMPTWKYDAICIAAHETITVREIVEIIQRLTQSKSKIIVDNCMRKPFCIVDNRAMEMGYHSISPANMVERMVTFLKY